MSSQSAEVLQEILRHSWLYYGPNFH